jgi:hypothetical protein
MSGREAARRREAPTLNDRFRLVRNERRPKPAEARRALAGREVADGLTEHRASAPQFPNLKPAVRQRAIERFWELRECELQKPPSTAELLVWLAVLNALGSSDKELGGPLAELPALGSLIKDKDDLDRLKRL